tara:strand:+ start:8461 stop:9066 length:606 start_codon:yes stop_codon:yes gene_type:complete
MLPVKWQIVNSTDGMLVRVLNGLKAFCVQSYSEMNSKRGLRWAASRIIIDAPTSTGAINSAGTYYSIIKTGSLPVDLKTREFSRTGRSIVADIFINPVYSGGTQDPVYNSNDMAQHSFELELLVGFTLTDEGVKFAPSLYELGPASVQSKGATSKSVGNNYILSPNTSYLLKFYSTDSQVQDISVRIEGYEGELDVPNEDL